MLSDYAPVWFFVIACLVIAAVVISTAPPEDTREVCGWNDTKGGRIEVRCDHPRLDG